MTTATQSRRKRNAQRGAITEQFRVYDEAKTAEHLDKWEQLPLMVEKSGLTDKTIATVDAVLDEVGKTRGNLGDALALMRSRNAQASLRTQVDREAIATLKQQITDLEAQKQQAIDAFDEQLAPLRSQMRRFDSQQGRSQRAEEELLLSAPEWLQEPINATRLTVQQLERQCRRAPMPVMGEDQIRWNDESRKWEPIVPGDAAHEKSANDFNARLQAHREHAASLNPEIDAAKARLQKLLELAYQPWPTHADLAAIDG